MPKTPKSRPPETKPRPRSPNRPEESLGPDPSEPNVTPPPEVRTDHDRGIGEMGAEELDPGQPLNEPAKKPPRE
jgi:hypothetical protein